MHRTCTSSTSLPLAPGVAASSPRSVTDTAPGAIVPRACGATGCSVFSPGDLAALAVLGIVSEGCATRAEIAGAARAIAAPDWQPTGDLIAGALTRAVDLGHLSGQGVSPGGTGERFTITSAGAGRLRELLARPVPRCRGPVGRAATALKVCFLGALDQPHGCALLEDLSRRHRGELERLRGAATACPASCRYARVWIDREAQRIEQEVAWLESLRQELSVT